ncbi:MAG: flagellar basal body P-ring formation chaperone FlgA [Candidatus Marinimicrobia bacterium]|nr:flagellar basal body P-ring formation chaperone FlgA [Candidatus Neomarinimicrobiota bacterium]MCF7880532.1 flagellar basal body P-ring formation chaperone FlgA [Candidatus Neomarinimicrobiota bacterium]
MKSSTVLLGEVFSVSPVSSPLADQVKKITLIELRNPGNDQQIYEYQVIKQLKTHSLENHVKIDANFPITIESDARALSGADMKPFIDRYLQSRKDPGQERSVRWAYIREPQITVFPEGDFTVHFTRQGPIRPGRFALSGSVINGGYQKAFSLLLDIKITQHVFIAASDIPRGEMITDTNTLREPRSLGLRESQYAITSIEPEIGLQARRNIRKGDVVVSTMVRKRQVISSGQTVQVVLRHGNITVQSYGRAVDSGALTEQIRVKERQSGKIVTGTVINPSTIQIQTMQNL